MMTIMPAYGRDYRNKREIIDDLNEGKDFIETGSRRYINRSELLELGYTEVLVRYGGLRKVTKVKVPRIAVV